MEFHLTALEVASTVATVGLGGFLSKVYFDVREAWWKRTQWGLDASLTGADPALRRQVAIAALEAQGKARFMSKTDRRVITAALQALADEESSDDPPAIDPPDEA